MRKKLILVLLFCCLFFSGCTPLSLSGQNMMTPLTLSEEKSAVKAAFLEAAGDNAVLKYPQSGEHTEAIIFKDLNADGKEEAVIFYQNVNMDTVVHICILANIEGKWAAVWDHAGAGTEIASVSFLKTENGRLHIAVGYNVLNISNRKLEVFKYNGESTEILSEMDYIEYTVCDFEMDDIDDLLLIYDDGGAMVAAHYAVTNSSVELNTMTYVNEKVKSYRNVSYGFSAEGVPSVFIDSYISAGVLMSEMLVMKDGSLFNCFFNEEADVTYFTLRTSNLICMDYNADGIVEIPYMRTQTDTETASQLLLIELKQYQDNSFTTVITGYFDDTYHYFMQLPDKYRNQLTIERIDDSNEIAVYPYEQNKTDYNTPLFYIKCRFIADTSNNITIFDYQKAAEKASCTIYVHIPEKLQSRYQFINYEDIKESIWFVD